LRFLALVGKNSALQDRCNAKSDERLPILVTLRKYADELKSNFNLSILDFIVQTLQADFSNPGITLEFLSFFLESGQSILLFDGVDELPDTRFKLTIRDRIQALALSYPGNAVVVTSRIVGYEQEARFGGDCYFDHCQVAPLRGPEIEQFAREWHKARVEDERERDRMVKDLMGVLENADNHAISELACNPLLLTIIVLVHRIDAVLPDQRVLLYQKCVETLLITWHTWKYRASLPKRPDREDRRNLRRMEAIAEWMHNQAVVNCASREQWSLLTIWLLCLRATFGMLNNGLPRGVIPRMKPRNFCPSCVRRQDFLSRLELTFIVLSI
jgi:predicted NACHT family NTPase